ncbi:hypothetical protein [Bradyrhizobium sp. S69]|uniref:hypothetical protein n=1 Tax=Bradyrhizobium sp. S69 TaxID=1641856 RepID=UPI00131AEF4D|nr:hypothetical protein [Bradyrhizobium sp. S69]
MTLAAPQGVDFAQIGGIRAGRGGGWLEIFSSPFAGGGIAGRNHARRVRLSHAFAQRQRSADQQAKADRHEKIVGGPLMFASAATGPPCFVSFYFCARR